MKEIIDLILILSNEIKNIKVYLEFIKKSKLELFSQSWIDGQDVMQAMHISKRTLQSLRDNGTLPYSRLNGKFYYKISDIENILNDNYSNNKCNNHGTK